MTNALLRQTLGDIEWMTEHRNELRALFPETWTLAANLNMLQLGFGLKVVGVDWRNDDELAKVLTFLTKFGIVQFQSGLIRRAPR